MDQDTRNKISSKICGRCGGEAEGWKCPKCGKAANSYDPTHWQQCADNGKMQAKCKKCGEAESNCVCRS